MKLALVFLVGAGCGTSNPCDDTSGACVELRVTGSVKAIDQLELDLLWGTHHETTTTRASSGTTSLPLVTAITLDPDAATTLGVVAAGKLSGTVLGTAAGTSPLPDGTIELVLAPPDTCVVGTSYCGGDKLSGDPDTLYECNGGGVPHAVKACAHGCVVHIGDDDACAP